MNPSSLKIAIAVHGRFHAFDVARELLRRGHHVTLFTNYPKFAAAQFGVPPEHVRSLVPHGVITRAAWYLRSKGFPIDLEARLHTWFARWVAAEISQDQWDVVVGWSGIGEEAFRALRGTQTLRICQRGSAHIRVQDRLLKEEEARTGIKEDRPSPWMIAREEREYSVADMILVPSSFARETFLTEGIPDGRIVVLPLAVSVRAFRPPQEAIDARCKRIVLGEPLHVLNVGTFSLQKGMWDMREIIQHLSEERFDFCFVGPIAPACSSLATELGQEATFVPKRPQDQLPQHYAWGDVFLLPTIQDGYAMVLSQASAAGLPILTTTNSAGPDLVREGVTGWVLPIRSPQAFVERLHWCNTHRRQLAAMAQRIYHDFQPRDWTQVASDFETFCLGWSNESA